MGQFKIENAFFARRKAVIRFCIKGSCVMEKDQSYSLQVLLGQEKLSRARISMNSCREEILKHNQNKEFRVCGEFPAEKLKDGLRLLFCEGQKKEEYRFPYYRIQRMIKRYPICYAIDRYEMENDLIVIRGWVYSLFGEHPEYQLRNNRGAAVNFENKQVRRPDLNSLFQVDEDAEDMGFELEFHESEGETYKLIIQCGDYRVKVPVKPERIKKDSNKKSSPYISKKEIIKSLTPGQVVKDIGFFLTHGKTALQKNWRERYSNEAGLYEHWRQTTKLSEEALEKQRNTEFPYAPMISIIVPAYHTPKKYLCEMIASVQKQTYGNWELCIADGSGADHSVEKIVEVYLKDTRIRYKKLEKNEGIAGNTNQALKMASGEFVGLLDHDDTLAENALFEVVSLLNEKPETDVLYTDEDKVSADSVRYTDPYFKSDFNLDLLRSNNYICHFLVVRKTLADSVGGFDKNLDGAQDHDFVFRCIEKAREVSHIPQILYHWRIHRNSTADSAGNKAYCDAAGKGAVEAHLKRQGINGTVSSLPYAGFYRVDYELSSQPLVSILIPNRNEKESLEKCICSIMEKTAYRKFEIVVIENNSTEKEIFDYYKEIENIPEVRVIYWKDKFNYSAINNYGAKEAKGDYLVLLNNDTEIIEPEWLTRMLGDCMRPEVGIVGAMLYYPDDTIQHAGVIIGIGGVAGHIFKYFPRGYEGHFMKALLQQDLSAVTAACLMVKRKVFEEVGGLEEQLEVAFNDVDFCLKVRDKGYLIVFEPGAELYHYESKSRGAENTPEKVERFNGEATFMMKKWKKILSSGDPYYNKNLTLEREDSGIA